MAGIYIHIPFCRKACDYCNFHFSTSLRRKAGLIDAICSELETRKDYLRNEAVESIYFGGGTPSLLEVQEVEKILKQLHRQFEVNSDAEVSLEANPDDLDIAKLEGLKSAGINRLSIGIQSFRQEELNMLGRMHSAQDAVQCLMNARQTGFDHVSIDLIYGIQNSTEESWMNNLEQLKELEIEHFSAYSLTVEPKTTLAHRIKKGVKTNVDEELMRDQYYVLKEFAKQNGFIHYEISNFSKDGCFSIHNSNYWKNNKYLGVGPSAHSYNLESRQWNLSVNSQYIDAINNGQSFFEKEKLSPVDRFNEGLMLGLRTIWGANLIELFGTHTPVNSDQFNNRLVYYENMEFIERKGNQILLTDEGILFSDRIISDLFIDS
ncbi:radical SAM family heme chaperone HemW [Bacteroidota bacterium]